MTWGERNNVTVIAQDRRPGAVIFDAISAAKARGIDIVLADTAGRLPTQLHLMEEIAKVRRVIQKADPKARTKRCWCSTPTSARTRCMQVKAFDKAINVTGLVVTKLDGTAKGGVVAAIARQCPKPIRFIGVGEQHRRPAPLRRARLRGCPVRVRQRHRAMIQIQQPSDQALSGRLAGLSGREFRIESPARWC
jgi:signal recognition particle GTPase